MFPADAESPFNVGRVEKGVSEFWVDAKSMALSM